MIHQVYVKAGLLDTDRPVHCVYVISKSNNFSKVRLYVFFFGHGILSCMTCYMYTFMSETGGRQAENRHMCVARRCYWFEKYVFVVFLVYYFYI